MLSVREIAEVVGGDYVYTELGVGNSAVRKRDKPIIVVVTGQMGHHVRRVEVEDGAENPKTAEHYRHETADKAGFMVPVVGYGYDSLKRDY